jgi:hypothetical protein
VSEQENVFLQAVAERLPRVTVSNKTAARLRQAREYAMALKRPERAEKIPVQLEGVSYPNQRRPHGSVNLAPGG